MSAEPSHEAVLLLDSAEVGPVTVPFAGGEVVYYSARGPGKAVNEDAAALLPYPEGGLLLVCDGMGGQNAGARASELALTAIRERLARGSAAAEPLRHALLDGVEAANAAVRGLGVGAGTTLAAIALRAGRARPVHVGDSMVLHVGQRGRIKAWTVPHSPTGYAVEAGVLDEAEALEHEERHLVSNFVGDPEMRIELGASLPIASRDTLLVASDGLADNLAPAEIVSIVRRGALEDAGRELARLGRTRMQSPATEGPGHPDDMTFLLYRLSSAPKRREPAS